MVWPSARPAGILASISLPGGSTRREALGEHLRQWWRRCR
jgi:hypothetical protein